MHSILDVKNNRTQLEEKRAVVLSSIHVKQNKRSWTAVQFNPECSKLVQGYFIREQQSIFIERFENSVEQVETALTRLGAGYYKQRANYGQEIHAACLTASVHATFLQRLIDKNPETQKQKY